ncbi:hypothetical protein RUM44_003690 [Polyplax serrata]|uniref:Carboxylesterase type B domain-containing protein n=1 Tax=Polyplax serrata TaxID=468196 RepID=A0ABR1AIU3_POLSC
MEAPYAVVAFVHGESYEWNSGNGYEGNVVASYGHVIFVTINYRLGILGMQLSNVLPEKEKSWVPLSGRPCAGARPNGGTPEQCKIPSFNFSTVKATLTGRHIFGSLRFAT